MLVGKAFLERKNPYRDKKFALAVVEFKSEGLEQENLDETLEKLLVLIRPICIGDKHLQLNEKMNSNALFHGKEHSDRVAMLSMMIARNEGILQEYSDRAREILVISSYLHDIGRILPVGPHSKRGVKLVSKMELRYLGGNLLSDTDKNIVRMIIAGHDGKDKDIENLLKKYKIPEEDKEMATKLLFCVKDADALDRSRLTLNTPLVVTTDLNSKFLRYNSSKKLMDVSYGLEYLSNNIKNHWEILNYSNKHRGEHYKNKNSKENHNPWRYDLSKENMKDKVNTKEKSMEQEIEKKV